MSTRRERLNEVYAHLRKYHGIHTQGAFAEAIQYTRPVISSALNGNEDNLTDKLFRNVCQAFRGVFNLDYLLTGEGTLLTTDEDVTTTEIELQNAGPLPESIVRLITDAANICEKNREMSEQLSQAVKSIEAVKTSNKTMAHKLDEAVCAIESLRNQISLLVSQLGGIRPDAPSTDTYACER